jgi:hypothetical protein
MAKAGVATGSSVRGSSILREKDRVVATVDLKRVSKGTTGKVIMVQGLSWIRYWVLFDNGERIGTLHRSKLATLAEWENKSVAVPSSQGLASGVADVVEAGAAAAETIGGVPAHLLEKSRLARERWAAKAAG